MPTNFSEWFTFVYVAIPGGIALLWVFGVFVAAFVDPYFNAFNAKAPRMVGRKKKGR